MVAWPSSLIITRQGYDESPPDNVKRSSMDTGPDKVRRRTTANIRPIKFTIFTDDDGLEIMDDFYVTDTMSGSLRFDFVLPRNGLTYEARFVDKPQYVPDQDKWRISVSLELLP